MSDQDFSIFKRLLNHPDMMYVTDDKQKVYLLDPSQKFMTVFRGDFTGKTLKEINQIVCVMTEHC